MARRSLKICLGITAILIITIIIVAVVLFFTVFKPKQPKITPLPINLLNFSLLYIPYVQLNLSLELVVTIDNRNYGSFTYKSSVSNITYNGSVVAEVVSDGGTFPARASRNVSSTVIVQADKVAARPAFGPDLASGMFNFSSSSELHGKVSVLKIFKLRATAYSDCDITLFIGNQSANSTCKSSVKL